MKQTPPSGARAGQHSEQKLRWRSRRGMLELELVLQPFVRRRLAGLSEAERAHYAHLLEQDDWDIFEWIQGKQPPAPEFASLIDEIRAANAAPGDSG